MSQSSESHIPHSQPLLQKIAVALAVVIVGHVGVLWAVSQMKAPELKPIEKKPIKVKLLKIEEEILPPPPPPAMSVPLPGAAPPGSATRSGTFRQPRRTRPPATGRGYLSYCAA